MSGVFRVLLTMDVRADQATEFEAAWTAVATSIAGHPANLAQALMRGCERDGEYHILTDWTDEPSFRAFEHSEAHVAFRAQLAPYRSGVNMTTMRVVCEMSGGDRGGEP